MQSIIDSALVLEMKKFDPLLLQQEEEFSLIKKMLMFDEIVIKAKEDLAPHYIAKYCFDLAQ